MHYDDFPRKYYIQTRTIHGWHRLHDISYASLIEAMYGIERHIDLMFFKHNETLPTSIFRIVKCKPKKVKQNEQQLHEDTGVGALE